MSISSGLQPYSGQFGEREAYHLLRRTTFLVDRDRAKEAVDLGLSNTLDRLLAGGTPLAPPVNHNFPDDPDVPIGETWVTAPYSNTIDVNVYRFPSTTAWHFKTFAQSGFTLEGKMLLFWQNHFSCIRDGDLRVYYKYIDLLWRSSLGNFRQLIKDVSIDMQMLQFLDGLSNKASSPNENYARELLELFTLGKGEQVSQGDYTNYTEEDVRTLAKALTGWTVANWYSQDPNVQPTSIFQPFDHDTSTKQLSERFDNKTIENLGDQEIFRVVDIVFEQPMAADYICRKLYRYFVHYEITPQVESDIIQPLAATLRANDFEIKPVLRQLLGSEHFFDNAERAALIKNPLDFILDATLGLGLPVPTELDIEYYMYLSISWRCSEMTMDLQTPPSVAGFKAFYQSPLYNRHWINTSTLQLRHNLAKEVMWVGLWVDGVHRELDIFGFIEDFDNPSDPNELIAEFALRLYPKPLEQYQLDTLKGILIPGLPDFEWTIEYNSYLDDPTNEMVATSVRRKLNVLLVSMLSTAEIHLS